MKSYKNFVNGQMVDAVEGQSEPIISPVDERVIGRVPEVRREGRGPRGGRRGRGLRDVAGHDAAASAASCS